MATSTHSTPSLLPWQARPYQPSYWYIYLHGFEAHNADELARLSISTLSDGWYMWTVDVRETPYTPAGFIQEKCRGFAVAEGQLLRALASLLHPGAPSSSGVPTQETLFSLLGKVEGDHNAN